MDSHESPSPAHSPAAELPARVPRRYVGQPAKAPARRRAGKTPGNKAWDKLLLIVGVAAVIAAVLIVPGIVNRGGENPVAEAAQTTGEAPGFRMSFTMSVQGAMPATMSGDGVMNGETNRASMQFTGRGATPGGVGDLTISEVIDDLDIYVRIPSLAGSLGSDKSWLLIRADSFLGDLFQGSSGGLGAGMSASPVQQLEALESASRDVTLVGHEQVAGVDTSHYTATIDLQKVTDQLRDQSGELADLIEKTMESADPNQTVDIWIDGDGLIRRERSSMTMGPLGTFTMTMDLFDYGIHPQIDVPAESEVQDVTPMLEQFLGS